MKKKTFILIKNFQFLILLSLVILIITFLSIYKNIPLSLLIIFSLLGIIGTLLIRFAIRINIIFNNIMSKITKIDKNNFSLNKRAIIILKAFGYIFIISLIILTYINF